MNESPAAKSEITGWNLSLVSGKVMLGGSFALLVAIAILSWQWRYVHDSPLMIYAGFLVENGAVPYRDFFDMNLPGTYLIMWFMGHFFGWTDHAFRCFDLLCLFVLALLTYGWMQRMGRFPALLAAVAFPLYYLSLGPLVSMQREFIALVPFAMLLNICCGKPRMSAVMRLLIAGVLLGLGCLIKPQFFILSLPGLVFLLYVTRFEIPVRRSVLPLVGGMLIPLGIAAAYLVACGAAAAFLDMAFNYWPLYTHMTGSLEPIAGLDRLRYILVSSFEGLISFPLLLGLTGILINVHDASLQKQRWLLAGLVCTSALYPALSGQFWSYHWLPFHYMTLCAASLTARSISDNGEKLWSKVRLGIVACLLCYVCVPAVYSMTRRARGEPQYFPQVRLADEVSSFLSDHLKPGDLVQPLDWTGGAVHGMLRARAPLATRFIYDFHFYHHVRSPYIQSLRQEFMNEITRARPKYVIDIFGNKPWPTGDNTSHEFPELESYLKSHYSVVLEGWNYMIFAREDGFSSKLAKESETVTAGGFGCLCRSSVNGTGVPSHERTVEGR